MGLLQRLKHDLKSGLATLRLGTAQAANRALEETELLRLRLEFRRTEQELKELYRDVGERAVSLREAGEPVERVLHGWLHLPFPLAGSASGASIPSFGAAFLAYLVLETAIASRRASASGER